MRALSEARVVVERQVGHRLSRAPDIRYRPVGGVSERLQRVLDAMAGCPATLRTVNWDVVA